MRYEISEKAQQDLLNIESYLLKKWSIDVLEDFFEKFKKAITILLDKSYLPEV